MDKQLMRQSMRKRLREACPDTVSQAVCKLLLALPAIQASTGCALFFAMADEVDLMPLARELQSNGQRLAYPRYQPDAAAYELALINNFETDMVPGLYGIPEPTAACEALPAAEAEELVWIVPGLAFDVRGGRLGRGKAYYDRMLHGVSNTKVGVCRDWQLVDSVPMTEHDVYMDIVVTDRRSIVCAATPT